MKKLIARILLISVTAFFLSQVIGIFRSCFIDLVLSYSNTSPGIYNNIQPYLHIFTVIFVFWLISLLFLEIALYFKKIEKSSRLLRNLRYAPIFAFIFSIFIIPIFDFGMIEYSKLEIQNYVYNNSQTIEKPVLKLHNDYRHWCGNGAVAQENYLYFDTASEGINDENPYIRSRSLLMSNEVKNWLNGGDKRFNTYLAKSCRETDQIIHTTAENLLKNSESTCEKYLSSR